MGAISHYQIAPTSTDNLRLNLGYFYLDTYMIIVLEMYKRTVKSVDHVLCGRAVRPQQGHICRRLMGANYQCKVVIR